MHADLENTSNIPYSTSDLPPSYSDLQTNTSRSQMGNTQSNFSPASNTFPQSESETKTIFKFESEIQNEPPPSYREATALGWKNLRLKVKTARAFSAHLATQEPGLYSRNE